MPRKRKKINEAQLWQVMLAESSHWREKNKTKTKNYTYSLSPIPNQNIGRKRGEAC
jgi:hypothetical protein